MADVERLTNLTTGGPCYVDVKDGKILRITPIEFDETDAPSWSIEARGRTFTPPRKSTMCAWTAAHRSTIYSPKRILTPLKRVDWDPNGKRNIKNRGISGYEPISWDEATDIVTDEIIRVRREFGPNAMMTTPSSHHLWGNVGYRFSAFYRFMNLAGFCYCEHNPDSWEGWLWGGMHMWGFSHRLGIPEQYDLLEDGLKNTEMVVYWSCDPETTQGAYGCFESTPRRFWLKELGVKSVFIDPFFNNTAGLHSDKWLAPRPGTDVPIALAIAYTWLQEGTYDKDYVDRLTVGFDQWKAYVLGESDGKPKTPEWAESESGVPARDIRALAREWGRKRTMLAAGGPGGMGGACRTSTGNEWARAMIALAAMQGMGKPGSNIWSTVSGAPIDCSFFFPGYSEGGISGDFGNTGTHLKYLHRMFPNGGYFSNPHHSSEGNIGYRLRIPEMMQNETFEWYGKGFTGSHVEAQFTKYRYPALGYSPAAMYYRYGGSFFGTMNESNRYVRAYHSDKIQTVVNQNIWFEGETKFADIILPACTNFERWDIGDWTNAGGYGNDNFVGLNHRTIVFQKKCIEPLGESKSDYDIFGELAKKLGVYGFYSMGGKTDLDWVKQVFDATDLPKVISWEDFEKKGYYVVPPPTGRKSTPALRWFAEERERDTPDLGPAPWEAVRGKGLQTQSGKIEFVSNTLKRLEATGVVDPERPVMGPQYIESWEGHHTTDLYEKYPLQMISPHPRFSFHTIGDSKDGWTREVKDNRVLVGGHYYWIMRLNREDATARGIGEGDLVEAFNDRGSVILAARVTDRLPPGVVHSYESCGDYLPLGAPGESPDTSGCVNILTSKRFITPTSSGMSCNNCLIEVKKWEGRS